MTTQPDPAPAGQKPARELVEPLREIAALVLLGANAVLLFVTFVDMLAGSDVGFRVRAGAAFFGFIDLATIALPLIAVLLATFVTPVLPKAKLIVTVALVEYAVSAFFGLFFGLLIGVIGLVERSGVVAAFTGLLYRLAWAAVLGLAAYGVWTIFRGNYYTPRPKPAPPAPGMYGHPGQPYPGQQYPGQPYPGQPHPGQQQYGFPPQQQYGAPYGEQPQYGHGQETAAFPVQQPPPAGSPVAPQQPPYPAPQSGPPAPHGQQPPAQPYGQQPYGQQPQGPQQPQQPQQHGPQGSPESPETPRDPDYR